LGYYKEHHFVRIESIIVDVTLFFFPLMVLFFFLSKKKKKEKKKKKTFDGPTHELEPPTLEA
jgi:flagellar basal body-associated protein FliL